MHGCHYQQIHAVSSLLAEDSWSPPLPCIIKATQWLFPLRRPKRSNRKTLCQKKLCSKEPSPGLYTRMVGEHEVAIPNHALQDFVSGYIPLITRRVLHQLPDLVRESCLVFVSIGCLGWCQRTEVWVGGFQSQRTPVRLVRLVSIISNMLTHCSFRSLPRLCKLPGKCRL